MPADVSALSDDELRARRLELDELIQSRQADLAVLNRETDRREWERHAQAQAAALEEARTNARAQIEVLRQKIAQLEEIANAPIVVVAFGAAPVAGAST